MNSSDTCTCPSGDGSLRHPCPSHPTIADVQPGGRVRLGNGLPETVAQALATVNEAANDARHAGNYKVANALVTARVTLSKQLLALSAQPSPGGQDALELLEAYDQAVEDLSAERSEGWNEDNRRPQLEADVAELRAELIAALAARQPVESEENVAADTYWTLAEMIEPHVQREGINPDGALPASVHDSVAILLEHWLRARQPVGEPVAYRSRYIERDGRRGIWMYHHEKPEYASDVELQTLYAAPPAKADDSQPVGDEERAETYRKGWEAGHTAQAVDLGQFRPAVCAMGLYAEEPEEVDEAKRLLALIDSHTAGGQP